MIWIVMYVQTILHTHTQLIDQDRLWLAPILNFKNLKEPYTTFYTFFNS